MSEPIDGWWTPDFTRVEAPWWWDRPLAIVGTGRSLLGKEIDAISRTGCRVLAVKAAIDDLPNADACFGLDIPWMKREAHLLTVLAKRTPLWLALPDQPLHTHHHCPPIEGAHYLRKLRICGALSVVQTEVESGGNSGFGAFNFAILKRARRIVLFGFDYAPGHYCEDRYTHAPPNHNARYWPRWAENYRGTVQQLRAAGVEVFNASPASNVDAFERGTYEQGLERLDRR